MKQAHIKKRIIIASVLGVVSIGIASTGFTLKQKSNETQKPIIEQSIPEIKEPVDPLFLGNDEKWADSVLATLSTEKKIAQFFMVAAWSSEARDNHTTIDPWITELGIGGIIFFQGDTKREKVLTEHYQSISKVPMLIGIDGEWGLAMRLTDCERYPYQLTMGATHNPALIEDAGYWIGRECQDVGVHIDFAPDVDVNSNPKNPVINYRSFGEDPNAVGDMAGAFVTGMERSGVLSCAKHFPGHGDTDKDSHLELPSVNHSQAKFDSVDFVPFKRAIENGTSSIMVAHLNVPSLDSSKTPTSLSSVVIKDWLQDSLKFKGLVISDALNMKGVASIYGKTDVVVKAFIAGDDILLFPESVSEAITAIADQVKNGKIAIDEINTRCKKVLKAKYWAIQRQKATPKLNDADSTQIQLLKQRIAEQSVTILKNDNNLLPLKDMSPKTAIVIVGEDGKTIESRFSDYMDASIYHATNGIEAQTLLPKLTHFERVISVMLSTTVRPTKNYGFTDQWLNYLSALKSSQENIVLILGNPYSLINKTDFQNIKSLVLGYENSDYTQDAIAQVVVGALPAVGKLPVNVNSQLKLGDGIITQGGLRLHFTVAEDLGVNHHDFDKIDSIVEDGIEQKAFPGCQIVVAYKGNVIYRKSFGTYAYDKQPVTNATVYDLASVTKIAASTLSIMYLDGKGKFSLDSTIHSYLPDLVDNTPYSNVKMRDMLAHQARFTPWIPFYTKTLTNGNLRDDLYSNVSKPGYTTQVTKDLFILDSYKDSIYQQILNTPLSSHSGYKYSDVGYYFIRQIIQKQTNQMENEFVLNTFYKSMGLHSMRYLPLEFMPQELIAPTENDQIFRKKLIQGYVHDQGAAMLGGVGGHAGLFSNATDLAALMQLYLNGGTYGGIRYLEKSVLDEYTSCQFCPSNRRGAGFDKPVRSLDGGPTCNLVSLSSFGHSGFTGTLAWADPENEINYVFLSNRVYPDAENKKLITMGQRTKIQAIIYQAIKKIK